MGSTKDWQHYFSHARHHISSAVALLPRQLRPHALALMALLLLALVVALWPSSQTNGSNAEPVLGTSVLASDANPTTAINDNQTPIEPAYKEPEEVLPQWQTYTVTKGDTLSGIFDKLDLGATTLRDLLSSGEVATQFSNLRPGDEFHFKVDADGHLLALKRPLNKLETLIADYQAEGDNQGWHAEVQQLQTTGQSVIKTGVVNGILSINLRDAGIPSSLAHQFVNIFRWKVDYQREMRAGATFAVIYEDLEHNGEKVKSGPIVAAELTNAGKTLRVYRYDDAEGHAKYYTADGRSLEPSILRTPVHYSRVSSPFAPHRMHPVLHYARPHYGVDLASPSGTPIKAAADGRVKFVGWSGGYGRLVKLDNIGAYSTRYGHMSRFARGLKKGDRVKQGQIIGYVGQSGVATGPHLHYEIRINGKPYDPLTVKLPDSSPLPSKMMASFKSSIEPLVAALDAPDTESAERTLAAYDADQLEPIVTASVEPQQSGSTL